VHILQHQHRGSGGVAQLGEQRGQRRLAVACGQRRGQRAALSAHGIAQRPQRARRDQVVTRTDQETHPVGKVMSECADEAGLADPRLARDQNDRTCPGYGPL
jgi:hypothetical protein